MTLPTTLDEKSRLSIPGSVAVALLFAWLLYLTRSVESMKTDVAVIRAHIEPRSAPAATEADSAVVKNNK